MKIVMSVLVLISATAFAQDPTIEACLWMENKRTEMNVISSNIANLNTTRTPAGGPYLRKQFVCKNVIDCQIIEHSSVEMKYLPDHPDANASGMVLFPSIDVQTEMDAMITALHEYEAFRADCR